MCDSCRLASRIQDLIYEGKNTDEVFCELTQEEIDNPISVLATLQCRDNFKANKPKINFNEEHKNA
jgi:hypothetical protein